MRKRLLTALVGLCLPLAGVAELSVEEVIRLKQAGVSEAVIIEMIRQTKDPATSSAETDVAPPPSAERPPVPRDKREPQAPRTVPVIEDKLPSAPAGSRAGKTAAMLTLIYAGNGYTCSKDKKHGSATSTISRSPGHIIATLDGRQVAEWVLEDRELVSVPRTVSVTSTGTRKLSFRAGCLDMKSKPTITTAEVDIPPGGSREITLRSRRGLMGTKYEISQ